MALSIAELRNRINAQPKQSTQTESSIFSFSKLEPGDQVRIRFVADADENDVFWRPLCTRRLKFNSLKLANGSLVANQAYASIPAFMMKKGESDPVKLLSISHMMPNELYYSNDDVINTKIKPLWDGTPEGTALYNRFGRTERYIFQGFVRSEGYETKLYRFIINKDLFNIIKGCLGDDEIDAIPSDPIHGREFILKVSEKTANINGTPRLVKDYSTSKWSSKETPLTEEEQAWLDANQAYVLKNFIPSRPTIEQEKVMIEMFDASYNDEPYDVAKWGKIFKPDNIYFDELGNIRDVKGGNNNMTQAHEVPAQATPTVATTVATGATVAEQVAPTVYTPIVEETPIVAPQAYTPEQMQALVQALAQQQASAVSTSSVSAQPTAPQLIKEHTVETPATDPNDLISGIMNRLQL